MDQPEDNRPARQKTRKRKTRLDLRRLARATGLDRQDGTPFAAKPRSEREIALLSLLVNNGGSTVFGCRGAPPLTDDMRRLIRKGEARIERRFRHDPAPNGRQSLIRLNHLVVTDAGRQRLTGGRPEHKNDSISGLRSAN